MTSAAGLFIVICVVGLEALRRRPTMSVGRKLGMSALRPNLAVATILVIVKIIELAVGH